MIKVGLTGGIGSGKTVVANVFRTLGIPVYNSDVESGILTREHPAIRQGLIDLLGNDIYLSSGELNKLQMTRIIFSDPGMRSKVNSVIHPVVISHFNEWYNNLSRVPYAIKESALLFESNSWQGLDVMILVTAPEKMRIERVVTRDGKTKEVVRQIMLAQMNDEEKRKNSQYEIVNDSLNPVIPQVMKIHAELLKKN